jgi:pimeloyl-ACP methyl ester carboxylesterase
MVLAGCDGLGGRLPAYHGDRRVRGSVERVEAVGAYPASILRLLIWYAKPPAPITVREGVRLYRISYWSQTNGSPVLVSGLMAVPSQTISRGTVLWMHGTNVDRKDSPSTPSLQDGVLLSGTFAGGGYLYLAPDLVGLGISKGPQAYLYNPSTIAVSLDFLTAAQRVTSDLRRPWSPDLYVAGFSQGGHDAAVIARELERLKRPQWRLRAAAGLEGAYNLAEISFPLAMTGASPSHAIYLTTLALSYATDYGQPLQSVLTPSSAERAHRLFDGDHSGQIIGHMPTNPREMFTAQFLADFDGHRPDWFMDALRANEAYRWAPAAPFRAYYGDKDLDVSPEEAKAFAREAVKSGGHVEAIPVGPYDHFGSVLHAVPKVRQWFDEISTETARP